MWAPLATGAGVLGAVAVLRARDPHVPGSYGYCPLLTLTGFDCPLCGGLRATHSLAHGEVAAALDANVLYVASVPLLLIGWLWWVAAAAGIARPYGWTPARMNTVLVALPVVLAVFAVVRNLPGLEMLRSGV